MHILQTVLELLLLEIDQGDISTFACPLQISVSPNNPANARGMAVLITMKASLRPWVPAPMITTDPSGLVQPFALGTVILSST